MNIEVNKKDFERALEKLEENIPILDECLAGEFIEAMQNVVNEYNGHYKDDIENLYSAYQDALLDDQ